jgi:O-antigen/teichoic acid export membrane protein
MNDFLSYTPLYDSFRLVMLANLITGGINFVAMAWFALKLGPTAMGEYAIIVTSLQVIFAFLSAGFDQAVIREPDCEETSSAACLATVSQSSMLLVACGIAYIIFYAHSPVAAGNLIYPCAVMLGSMIISLFSNLFAAPIAARLDYRYLSYTRLFATLAGVGTGILLVMKGTGLYALVFREFITVFGALIIYKLKSPLQLISGKITRSGLHKLMHFASGTWALNTLERVVFRMDYVLVGAIFGKELLGMYFVLRGLVEGLLGFLIAPIQTVLYTYYCRLQEKALLRWPITSGLSIAYWSGVFVMALLGYCLSPLVVILVGEAYNTVHSIVPCLVFYAGSTLWYENAKVWFMAQQMHHKLIVARMIQLFLIVIAIYPFAKVFQIFGAGLATAVGALSLAATAWFFVKKNIALKAQSGSYSDILTCSASTDPK